MGNTNFGIETYFRLLVFFEILVFYLILQLPHMGEFFVPKKNFCD